MEIGWFGWDYTLRYNVLKIKKEWNRCKLVYHHLPKNGRVIANFDYLKIYLKVLILLLFSILLKIRI